MRRPDGASFTVGGGWLGLGDEAAACRVSACHLTWRELRWASWSLLSLLAHARWNMCVGLGINFHPKLWSRMNKGTSGFSTSFGTGWAARLLRGHGGRMESLIECVWVWSGGQHSGFFYTWLLTTGDELDFTCLVQMEKYIQALLDTGRWIRVKHFLTFGVKSALP